MATQDFDGNYLSCPECGHTNLSVGSIRPTVHGGKQRWKCKECNWHGSGVQYASPDDIKEKARLAKRSQKLQDTNRVERKNFREYARVENTAVVLNEKLIGILEKHRFQSLPSHPDPENGAVGIVQLSDLHFNELIEIPGNNYDFKIAAKRLQKHA